MDEYLSEKEQIERIKKWWKENWTGVVAGFVLAGLVISGWFYWKHRVQTRSETASAMFEKLNDAVTAGNGADVLKLGTQLTDDYSDTPYAAQGALTVAAYDVKTSKPDDGMKMLDWVISHGKDQSIILLARLRLARVQIATGDAQAALKTLTVKDEGGFAALYGDVRGDAYMQLGDREKARAAYASALADWKDELGDKSLLQMKLNNLGAAAAAKSTTGEPAK